MWHGLAPLGKGDPAAADGVIEETSERLWNFDETDQGLTVSWLLGRTVHAANGDIGEYGTICAAC